MLKLENFSTSEHLLQNDRIAQEALDAQHTRCRFRATTRQASKCYPVHFDLIDHTADRVLTLEPVLDASATQVKRLDRRLDIVVVVVVVVVVVAVVYVGLDSKGALEHSTLAKERAQLLFTLPARRHIECEGHVVENAS